MSGIARAAAHVPYRRLDRSAIREVAGVGGGKGTRAVASFDEDSTTLAVAAARGVLRDGPAPSLLLRPRLQQLEVDERSIQAQET